MFNNLKDIISDLHKNPLVSFKNLTDFYLTPLIIILYFIKIIPYTFL